MLSSRLCFFSFLLLRRYRAASIHVTTTKMTRTPRTTDSMVTTVPENKASKIEKEKGIYKVLNHNHKLNTIIGMVGLRNTIIGMVGLRNTIIGIVGLRNTIIGIVGLRNTIIEIVGLRNTIIGIVGLRNTIIGIVGLRNTIIGIVGLRNTIIEIVGLRNTIIGIVGLRLVYRCPLVTVKKATIYIQASFQFLLLHYLICSHHQNMARLMFTLVF